MYKIFCAILILPFLFLVNSSASAQSDLSLKIIDANTKEELAFANVYLKHNQLGNSTNLNGETTLKLKKGYVLVDTLLCSYIGYQDTAIPINLLEQQSIKVHLKPQLISLPEVTITAISSKLSAKKIVKKAMKGIKQNYATTETVLSGFYRELISENNKHIQLNEAFFDLYYTSYPQKRYTRKGWRAYYATYPSADFYPSQNRILFSDAQFLKYYNTTKDQCRIIASRSSENWAKDEIEVIPVHGPLDLSAADKVKYEADFLDPKLLKKYTYKKSGASYVNGEPCFVITFKPKKLIATKSQDFGKKTKVPIYAGAMYISINSFAIVKFECQLAEGALPPSRFRPNLPTSVTLTCEYKKEQNKWYLNKVINEQLLSNSVFKSFENNTLITRELHIQNIEAQKVQPFPYDDETTFINRRTGNLRYFATKYDSSFWKQTKNYIPLPENAQLDLEEQQSLDFQFKDRFIKKNITVPLPSSAIKSMMTNTNIGFDPNPIKKMKDKELFNYIKAENDYFKNYFVPQKSEFAKARNEVTSKTKLCDLPENLEKEKMTIVRGYSNSGKFGIILKNEYIRKLLVDLDEEICKTCSTYNYQLNKDSTIFSCMIYDPEKPHYPVLFLKDIVNNKLLEELDDLQGYYWLNATNVLYLTIDEALRSHVLNVYSTSSGKSSVLFETKTNQEEVEYFYTSKDKSKIFFIVNNGDFNQVVYVNQQTELKELYPESKKIYSNQIGEDDQSFFLLIRNQNWQSAILKKDKSKLLKDSDWNNFLTESSGELIDDFAISENFIAVKIIKNGIIQLFNYDKSNLESRKEIKFPSMHHSIDVYKSDKFGKDTIVASYSAPETPPGNYVIDLTTGSMKFEEIYCYNLRRKQTTEKYSSNIVEAPSLNKSESILIRLSQNANPNVKKKAIILKVYGTYGAFLDENFDEFETFFMDKGYIIAKAHVRGSRAKGWQWYADGKGSKKKNTINDFIASAKYLKEYNKTKDKPIIAYGQSAGGTIVGAAINEEAQLFIAAILDYAYLDVWNTIQNEALPLTTLEYQEWGYSNIKKDLDYVKTYSPYQNISAQSYPDMLFFAGTRDFQTPYEQILKSIWRYRKNNTSESDIIIHLGNNGHPGSFPYSQRSKEIIYQYLFAEKVIDDYK